MTGISKKLEECLRACLFTDLLHFKGCPYINHKISLQFERYHDHFFDFSQSFYDASSYGSTYKIPSINDGLNPNLKRDVSLWSKNMLLNSADLTAMLLI